MIDTSSIIFAMQNRKDIFSITRTVFPGCEICVSQGVISELRRISFGKTKKGRNAATGLLALHHNNISIERDKQLPDEWMANASSNGHIFVTNDTKLWHILKSQGKRAAKLSIDGRIV